MKDEKVGMTKHASYYAAGDVDPIEFGRQHDLNYSEIAIIKYATRWRKPNGGWTGSLEKIIYLANRLKSEAERGLHSQATSTPSDSD